MICRLLSLLVPASLGLAQQVWQLQNANLPAGASVGSLSAVDNQTCWAAGVIHTTQSPGTAPYPGYSRTTDGGNTWVCDSIPGAENGNISQIVGLDANTAFAAVFEFSPSNSKGVYKTTDGGETWTKQNAFSSSLYGPGFIYFFDANNGVVIGDPNLETYTTTNGGVNWNPVSMPPALTDEYTWIGGCSIAGAGDRVWFASTKRILRSTDRGRTWSVSLSVDAYAAIAFQDSNTGLCCLYPNSYRKTTDGGLTWNPLTNPVIDNIDASCIRYVPSTRSTYLVSGSILQGKRGFARTYNSGEDWTLIDTSGLRTIAFSDINSGWGSPDSGNEVYKYVGVPLAVESRSTAPVSYLLAQNYPNPFNPSTVIGYRVEGIGDRVWVTLKVYDILGREVATLVNERKAPGNYEVRFDASGLSTGVYLYKLTAGQFVQTRKMVVVK